jgi:hypothetical protein
MANITYKLFADKMGGRVASNYVGTLGEIFYDPADGALRVSDGATLGGIALSLSQEPNDYRGFYAGFNSFYGDDPSVQQIIISKSATSGYRNREATTDSDSFNAIGLGGSRTVIALNVYGNNTTTALTPTAINTFARAFIDAVLFDGESERTSVEDIQNTFYANIDNLIATHLPENSLYENFQFFDQWSDNITVTGTNSNAVINVYTDVEDNYKYKVDGIGASGSGFTLDQVIVIPGTDIGFQSPQNDLTITITALDGDGIADLTVSGTGMGQWPENHINDGGHDQYDGGNYLNTNLATELSYNNGQPVFETSALNGGDYAVAYKNSVFVFIATNADISEFYYSGGMGADGNGSKIVRALFGMNNMATNLGNLRIADWGYPGNSPVRLTHQTYGESIFLQSTDNPQGNNGRSGIRWHIRPEPNSEGGSKYSQVVVDNQGTRINNSDWSGSDGVWNWNFDNSGVTHLPQLNTNGGGSVVDGGGNVVVALDSEGNKVIGDSSNQEISVGSDQSHTIPNFSGMVMVNDHYDGGVELWICGGAACNLISATRPLNVGTMEMGNGGYVWTNPASAGLTGPFTFTVIKTRNGS